MPPIPAVVSGVSAVPPLTPPPPLRQTVDLRCGALAPSGCDVRSESCQRQLFALAHCLAARDGVRPPLRFITEAEARQSTLKHRAESSGTRGGFEQAVSVLGLGAVPATAETSRSEAGLVPHIYYSPSERAVFLVDNAPASYPGELAVLSLVHEYVHALQDHQGELLRVQNGRDARSFDQELALRSAFEGEAALYEEVVRAFLHARVPETWVTERLGARTGGTDDAIIRQRRPLEASLASFPYTYGAYWAALETARPSSTQQLLARRHGWPPSDALPCDDESPPSFAPDYPRQIRETLGAWLIQAYVRKLSGDPERARSAARSWRGDWLSLYSRGPRGPWSFIWQTCWDSPQTAARMQELIELQLRETSSNRASVTLAAQRVTATMRAEWRPDLATNSSEP